MGPYRKFRLNAAERIRCVPRPDPSGIGAVFVTYHPDPALSDRVSAVVEQAERILIIDNGSTDQELRVVEQLVRDGIAEAIFNRENRGLAAALNQGMAWGEKWRLAWVLTFDQDTVPGPRLVAEAGHVFDAHHGRPLAVIGAGWVSRPDLDPDCDDPGGKEEACVITSGALHSVAIWRALGGFREDFFIDYVDTEFCLRARAAGYLVAQACVPTMVHVIGQPTRRRLLLGHVTPSNHSRMRRYFITRNRLWVWRMYARREPQYVRYDVKAFVKELVKLVLLEEDRPAKLLAVVKGIRDGLMRRPDRGVEG